MMRRRVGDSATSFVRGLARIAVLLFCLAGVGSAASAEVLCTGSAPAAAKAIVEAAIAGWNTHFGSDVLVGSCTFTGVVTDVNAAVDAMLDTAAFPTDSSTPGRVVEIATAADVQAQVPASEIAAFESALSSLVQLGDSLVLIGLADQVSSETFETVASIGPDGQRLTGTFPTTGRFETFEAVDQFGSVCKRVVATQHLWGSEAEFFRGCVRVTCDSEAKVIDCKITENEAFASFFAEARILPPVGTNGSVVGECCDGFFNYVWATGFKKVKVAANGVTLEIEGNIGQSGNGGFTVTECCTTCKITKIDPATVQVTVQNKGSGLAEIRVKTHDNANVTVPSFTRGTTSLVIVTAQKINPNLSSRVELEIVDLAGNVHLCDPVLTMTVRDRGKPVTQVLTGIPAMESNVTVYNENPGVTHLLIEVNGVTFRMQGLRPLEERTLDISSAMHSGGNVISLTAHGKPGGSAVVLIHD